MRALVSFFLFLNLAFIASPSVAIVASAPTPVLEIEMKGHYATETTKVFRSGNVWVCKTELRPYFENKTQVYDTKALRELGAASRNRSFTDCRDRIAIVDRTIKGKLTALVGCRENPAFGQFVDQVARNCGR